jgi:uncharacterized membrane protein YccF (DUF307 family)
MNLLWFVLGGICAIIGIVVLTAVVSYFMDIHDGKI